MSDHGRQIAQIAGATSGIGLAIAESLAGQDLRVFTHAKNAGAIREPVGKLPASGFCGRRRVPDTGRFPGPAEPDVVNAARDGLQRRVGGEAAAEAAQADGEAVGETASLGQS